MPKLKLPRTVFTGTSVLSQDAPTRRTRCVACHFWHTGAPDVVCATCQAKRTAMPHEVVTDEPLHVMVTRFQTQAQAPPSPAPPAQPPPLEGSPRPPMVLPHTRKRFCKVCVHPDAAVIKLALLQGVSTTLLHTRYGLASSTLSRHRRACLHLPKMTLSEAAQKGVEVRHAHTETAEIAMFALYVRARLLFLEREMAALDQQITTAQAQRTRYAQQRELLEQYLVLEQHHVGVET